MNNDLNQIHPEQVVTVSPVFSRVWDLKNKNILLRGGTGSSKTISILQTLMVWLMTGQVSAFHYIPKGVATVARRTHPALYGGALRDFEKMLRAHRLIGLCDHNKTRHSFEYMGRLIEFISMDDIEKAKSQKRDILYLNELVEWPNNSVFNELAVRTRSRIFLDYNPSNEFSFVNRELEEVRLRREPEDWALDVSTYLDNPFLEKSIIKEIENYQTNDPMRWRIMGRGEWGASSGLIYHNWDFGPRPEGEPLRVFYGLDLGYIDQTALVKVEEFDGDLLYITKKIYKAHLRASDIVRRIKAAEPSSSYPIFTDASQLGMFESIRSEGVPLKKADKRAGSVLDGITLLKEYQVIINYDSPEIKKEVEYYRWKLDRYGESTEEPQKGNDHLLDAIRYAVMKGSIRGRRYLRGVKVNAPISTTRAHRGGGAYSGYNPRPGGVYG